MVFNKNADIDSSYSNQFQSLNQTSNDKNFYPKCKCLLDIGGLKCIDETTLHSIVFNNHT